MLSPRARGLTAWGVVVVAVVPALLAIVPPWTMLQVELAVLTKEASPLLLLLTLLAIPVAVFLATGRVRRIGVLVILEAAALVEMWPLIAAHRAADFSYSLRYALLGDADPTPLTERRVSYAASDGTPLSLLIVRGPTPGRRATVVVLYGGAWRHGDATQALDASRYFARRGYTVIALDYRHAPAHRYPAAIDDVRRGLSLVRDSSVAWGVDTARVAIIGRSAGGHLAMLAAFDPVPPLRIRAVAAFYAPYDLAKAYDDRPSPDPIDVRAVLRDLIGGTPTDAGPAYHAASPSAYIRSGLPPTLLVYARHDHLVLPKFGRAAARDLRAAGDSVTYVELPWAEHGFDLLPNEIGSQIAIALLDGFLSKMH